MRERGTRARLDGAATPTAASRGWRAPATWRSCLGQAADRAFEFEEIGVRRRQACAVSRCGRALQGTARQERFSLGQSAGQQIVLQSAIPRNVAPLKQSRLGARIYVRRGLSCARRSQRTAAASCPCAADRRLLVSEWCCVRHIPVRRRQGGRRSPWPCLASERLPGELALLFVLRESTEVYRALST